MYKIFYNFFKFVFIVEVAIKDQLNFKTNELSIKLIKQFVVNMVIEI